MSSMGDGPGKCHVMSFAFQILSIARIDSAAKGPQMTSSPFHRARMASELY